MGQGLQGSTLKSSSRVLSTTMLQYYSQDHGSNFQVQSLGIGRFGLEGYPVSGAGFWICSFVPVLGFKSAGGEVCFRCIQDVHETFCLVGR